MQQGLDAARVLGDLPADRVIAPQAVAEAGQPLPGAFVKYRRQEALLPEIGCHLITFPG